MEELLEIRTHIEQGRYPDALLLINEMEEMAKDDKIHKIRSYAIILLLHLIKQQAENRTSRSWDLSIRNAVREINVVNKRKKSGGIYANLEELTEILQDAFESALDYASAEAFGGVYTEKQLGGMIDQQQILAEAFALINVEK